MAVLMYVTKPGRNLFRIIICKQVFEIMLFGIWQVMGFN